MLLFRNKIHNFRIQFTKLDSSWGQGPRRHFETGGSRFIFCRGIHMIRQNFPCFTFFPRKKWGGFGPPTDEGPAWGSKVARYIMYLIFFVLLMERMLQNLPYFIYKKRYAVFFFFQFEQLWVLPYKSPSLCRHIHGFSHK